MAVLPSIRAVRALTLHDHICGLAAPNNEMRLRQVGQHIGDNIASSNTKTPKSVGRLPYAADKLVMGPDAKQTFIGYPTNVCLDSFVFAEFFPKTGKPTFGNSA